jgi:hypothetical protein
MTMSFFAFFRLTVTLLCLPALFQISQHPAQITAVSLTTIASQTNMKFSTTKLADDELQQKRFPSDLAIDRKWG